jgi:hypothetical protein
MAINKEIKKRIAEEWLIFIPQLSVFAQNKLYRVVGCSIIGLELIKLPHSQEYRPHFIFYPLWKDDVKKCLDTPFVYFALRNNKGLQFDIPYLKHSNYFNEAIESLKKQLPILWNKNIALKSLFDVVDSRFDDILIKTNSAQQAKLFELKFYTALYTRNQSEVQSVLNHIQHASKSWNMQMFEMWYGKFEMWFQELQEKVNSQEDFLKQIELNKQDKKISQLKSSQLEA